MPARPRAILAGSSKVHQYGIMSAPTTAQDAALVAITTAEADVGRDARRVRPPPPAPGRWPERPGSPDLRAARRVLRVPADHLHRPGRRGIRRAPPRARSTSRPCRAAPSGRPVPATSGCATRRPTSDSRRRWSGSAASRLARGGRSGVGGATRAPDRGATRAPDPAGGAAGPGAPRGPNATGAASRPMRPTARAGAPDGRLSIPLLHSATSVRTGSTGRGMPP